MIQRILVAPDPILSQKAAPVSKFNGKLRNMIADMKETLLATSDPKGVGLAASQIGIPVQIFQMKPKDDSPVTTFINPVITFTSQQEGVLKHINSEKVESAKPKSSKKRLLEGCLSLPNIWGHVSRKKEVTLSWQDEHGKHHRKKFKGFLAVIIQHEMDHLSGILFTKHVLEQGEKLYRSYKDEEGKDEFEEIKV